MKQGWTWQSFLSWAFGPRRLAQIAVLVDDAQRRIQFLEEVPDATAVSDHLRLTLREIGTRCEGLLMLREADLANSLASLAGSGSPKGESRDRLRDGCAALERMVGRRLATMAWLLRLAPADEGKAAA